MTDVAITAEALGKRYRIGAVREPYYTLRDAIVAAVKAPARLLSRLGRGGERDTIWALKEVSFEVKRGEVVGVIGRNGAGKSTLLRILSRITKPTEGHAEIHGRVGSLLEVGTGFHPELTGRENIFLNGSILGMKRREIARKFDEIVAFAEVEKFIDTPVKRYSSGMQVRLAFAVAAHLEPEILLVDEVLAVGDAAFQKKCLGKMGDVAAEGRTVLFVSHNMAAVGSMCARGLVMSSGHTIYDGETSGAIAEYFRSFSQRRPTSDIRFPSDNKPGQIRRVKLETAEEQDDSIEFSKPIEFRIEVEFKERCSETYLAIVVHSQFQQRLIMWRDTELVEVLEAPRRPGTYDYLVTIPPSTLAPGHYQLELALVRKASGPMDWPQEFLGFSVSDHTSVRSRKGFPWKSLTAIPLKIEYTFGPE